MVNGFKRKDNNGNLYYDHAIQTGALKKTLTGNKSGGLKNSALNIEEEAFVVNLFFK